jgi:hypothetical protein
MVLADMPSYYLSIFLPNANTMPFLEPLEADLVIVVRVCERERVLVFFSSHETHTRSARPELTQWLKYLFVFVVALSIINNIPVLPSLVWLLSDSCMLAFVLVVRVRECSIGLETHPNGIAASSTIACSEHYARAVGVGSHFMRSTQSIR